MWAALTTMRNVAVDLQDYGSFDAFTRDVITMDEGRAYIRGEPMA